MTQKELMKRLEKEYDNLVQEGLDWSIEHDENEHVYFLNHAYEFAHYNEIISYFECLEEEDWSENWEELMNSLSKDIHILSGVYNDWLDYSHPERFNFFCWEDLGDIIRYWVKKHI